MLLDPLRHALGAAMCAVAGHRFVVWARSCEPAPRHPHLGAWVRCDRCGHERDWLGGAVAASERMLDLVHGVVRPLDEIQAIARGERAADRPEGAPPAPLVPAVVASARAGHKSSRPMVIRRRSNEGRTSTKRATSATDAPHDEREPG